MDHPAKVLVIGNYPPPMCGWAIQTKLVTDELRRRGHVCEILKINEGRRVTDPAYVDVQGGLDYLRKVWRYTWRGYQLNVHLNGMGRTGYLLALIAVLVGRLVNRPAMLTFHGGLPQNNFPRYDNSLWHWAFYFLFRLSGPIACDDANVKTAIEGYGIRPGKVYAIATFSSQYLDFDQVGLSPEVEAFLHRHSPIIFSYLSFRPEYRLETLREGMQLFRKAQPGAGFVWVGFPGRELQQVEESVVSWPAEERDSLLVLGNLTHDQFLTLLSRSAMFLRTPACDGVSASVLEALSIGVPVVASENGRRPSGVVTYRDTDASDMSEKLRYVMEIRGVLAQKLATQPEEDNVALMADWLSGDARSTVEKKPVAVV